VVLSDLVERQARRWQIDRRAGMPPPRGPVVALSRLPGAQGDEVGQRVAAWLDYGLFGAEEFGRVAADPALRERLVADLEAPARQAIDERIARVHEALPSPPDEDLRERIRVVATLAERGMAVLLGSGAAAVADPERSLRVLVVAPRALRIGRLAEDEGLALADAVAEIAAREAARAAFLERHLGVLADDPSRFDLVVNTQTLRVEGAAALVVEALRRRFPRD
jgi:cytidylate kinase